MSDTPALPRRYVGIDLGTTNSALAYIDSQEATDSDFPPIHALSVPQLTGPDRTEPRSTLPSFLFLADPPYAGAYAREQGALVPTKSVHSAKSWLSNAEVDRTAKILPWDAPEGGRVLSPVEVSTHYLRHLASAWEQQAGGSLALQNIVLTVPASFDEEARELTVQAARDAGLDQLTLVEEPAAAFYAWIAHHLTQSQKSLFDGMTVLVCDVGGGTSDFTLIRVSREGDRVEFTRTAVGKHLLLGGDNLDLTLAWLVESKLNKTLSLRQRSALRRQCAAAKERLLSDAAPPSVEITVLGGGTGLVGGTLKTEITREEVLELSLEGFLPHCELSDEPKEEKRSLFRELGLPYVSDPAITRHLAAFLQASGATPDAVLFNGGFFIPEILRRRVADVLTHWFGRAPLVLESQHLDLAVAVGAAYYGYVRSTGAGVVVRGGLPRSYYIELGGDSPDQLQTVCLVPRGTEEGAVLELDREDLQLVANRPVSFHLFSSLSRIDDQFGDLVTFPRGEIEHALHQHAPLQAVIRFGKRAEERLVPIKLGARLTEVGTLEIYADSRISEHRWRLQFELRKSSSSAPAPSRPAAVISEEGREQALSLIRQAFSGNFSISPEELPVKLETALALGRNSWPLEMIRRLADEMLNHADGRRRSAAVEARWLNLCGFCLRPGFGYAGDELRIDQVRRIVTGGLVFANQVQNEIEWWIFLGRVAGGFNRNQQVDLYQRLSPTLLPRGNKRARVNSSLLREMWRTAASLERLPVAAKTELGEALLRMVRQGEASHTNLWCLSRLGARELLYGPSNLAVPPATAARWVEAVASLPNAEEPLSVLARQTGDAARDLPPATMSLVRRTLAAKPNGEAFVAALESATPRDLHQLGRVFGEALPSGLVLQTDSSGAASDSSR